MELHSHRFAANPQTLIHRSWQSSPGFNGLTFGELCRRRRIRQPLPARPIVLTFDDGYATRMEGFR